MVQVRFTQPDGSAQEIDAKVGESLMVNAKANGIDGIVAECGGSMVCGTCHVYIGDGWYDRLPAPSDMELDMIDCGLHQQPNSRLACQIQVTGEMDGLEVHVPLSQR